jgi:hypothetical protein
MRADDNGAPVVAKVMERRERGRDAEVVVDLTVT